jgi:hypothetical protein
MVGSFKVSSSGGKGSSETDFVYYFTSGWVEASQRFDEPLGIATWLGLLENPPGPMLHLIPE